MFLVVEGLDGAGKSTQVNLIRQAFEERGITCEYLHFPRFDAPVYGNLIARFLRGELGSLESVDPYLVALLYAGDRQKASSLIAKWLADDKCVIADRYVYSNIAYQCAKTERQEEAEKLRKWILDLEYNHNRIVRPDLTLFLDVPFRFTEKKLAENREGNDRDYLQGKQDIHEASLALQQKVRQIYLAQQSLDDSFFVIPCYDDDTNMLSPNDIFKKIREKLF